MSVGLTTPSAPAHETFPPYPPERFHRLTVDQYQRMAEAGILTPSHRVELLDGWLVKKMPQNPPHAVVIEYTREALRELLPQEWQTRDQKPIVLSESVPEPDLVVARGPLSRYEERHPRPAEIALVVEVADSSLPEDRAYKGPLYARARLPISWIINIGERQVEVYTRPKGGKAPAYRDRQDYHVGDKVPLLIEGHEVGQVPVAALLPRGRAE
ncbi:MAG: Uma2 family endonuclease [Gemmataceae bacterium]|nr:Uma2 family endonuclease [Gemmataceae bacterium]